MMRAHFGAGAETIKLISPGTRFDTGDGIRMAIEQGASVSGDWNGMHIEPVDPRSKDSAPVVLVYPYGIVVDQDGRRFFDEGGGLVHETWEALRPRHPFRADRSSIAYAILDSRLFDIDGYERAIRSEVPPYQAETLEELAAQIGDSRAQSARARSMPSTRRRPATPRSSMRRAAMDWRRPTRLQPPKSNWARADHEAAVSRLSAGRRASPTPSAVSPPTRRRKCWASSGPMPGLYAAGETTGHFYGTAPNAVAVLRALVFGQIAGRRGCRFPAGSSNIVARIRQQGESTMASEDNGAFIRNIAEVPWREFPNHFGGALSKPLVMPETAGSRHIDYRISMYQPMAHVARHKHQVQEQIYHVLEGEGLMEIAGKNHVVRKHDFIFLPPGVEHAISNSGSGRSGVSGDHLAGDRRRQGRSNRAGASVMPVSDAYDVVVIGAGAGGMTAAAVAAAEGLSVLVIEKTEFVGGTTAWSGGMVWIPGQRADEAGRPVRQSVAMPPTISPAPFPKPKMPICEISFSRAVRRRSIISKPIPRSGCSP